MVSPGTRFTKRWEADAEQLMLRIDRHLVERGVGIALGDETPRSVCFNPDPVTASNSPALFDMIGMLCSGVDGGGGMFRIPAVAGVMADSLVQLILYGLANDRSEALACAASPACPSYVRRAERFIEQFADQPITVDDIAAHCGITSRTLSAGFRRFRNISPMEQLRSVRLARARAALVAGRCETNVTTIALECGISHLGRFARAYARRFGEQPSETLRRARDARQLMAAS
jgi:AraC-like DNA-binding protein